MGDDIIIQYSLT